MNNLCRQLQKIILGLLLFAASLAPIQAQKALQLEKSGSYNTIKFFVGDQLVYKLKGGSKNWLKESIREIYIEERMIEFENRMVHMDSIYAIQTASASGFVRNMSRVLISFSGIWTFWTGVSLLYGDPLALSTVIIGGGSFVIGQLIKLAFFKTHRIKGRRRLRLIDLTFYKPKPQFRT